MHKKVCVAIAALGVAVMSLAGCSAVTTDSQSSSGSGKGAVAVSFPTGDVTVWNQTVDVMKPIVKKAGYEFLTDNPNWDVQTQINDWQSWVSRGDVKAIIGFPIQVDSIIPVTAQANSANIPVLGYSEKWDGTTEYVDLDTHGAGVQVGEGAAAWLAKTYPDKKVGVGILADTTAELGKQQQEGMEDGLKSKNANVSIYELESNSRDSAYNNAQSALVAHPEIRVWLSNSGDMILGARQATIDSGFKETDFYGGATDAAEEGFKHIKAQDGMIREAYCFTPKDLGEAMGNMLVEAAEGKTPKHQQVKVTHIDQSNVDQYM